MFKNYSSEYTAVLATLLAPMIGNYFSDACAGEVSSVVATGVIAAISAGYLLLKRYQRGGVTPLGARE